MQSSWQSTSLGEALSFANGRTSPDRFDQGAYWVYGSNGKIGRASEFNSSRYTIVIGRVGSYCGSVHFSEDPCWVTDNAIRAEVRPGNHPYFIFSLLRFLNLNRWRVGSGQPLLNQSILSAIGVHLPSQAQQISIGSFLKDIDDRIDLLRQTNFTLEAIAQALFKSWFIDFDPVRAKAEGREPEGVDAATAALFPSEFEQSGLGMVPRGWRVDSISSVCDSIFSGGTPDTRRPEYWTGELNWFSSGETREPVVIDTEKRINQSAVDNSSTRLAVPGDVLIASAGQGFTRGQTSYCAIETYINQSVVCVRTSRSAGHAAWTFCNLSRRYEEMRGISDSHSSRGSLTTKLVASMPAVFPPTKLMHRFGEVAGALIERQENNLRKCASLTSIRDALLPRLISGKLRLSEVAETLESAMA